MSSKRNALVIILAACAFDSSDEEQQERVPRKKQRKAWRKEWVGRRDDEGFCAKLYRELRSEEPALYHNFLRLTFEQFDQLLSLVAPLISKEDTVMRKSISPADRLVLTLRFLATGDSFSTLQYTFRIPQTTISRIIPEVLDAIYTVLVGEYLKVQFIHLVHYFVACSVFSEYYSLLFIAMFQTPATPEAWLDVSRQYNQVWNFPNCIGAVDGKHVVMVAPPNAGSIFYNYKKTHSIILMGIADADYKFLYIDVGRNGRFSDGGVFNRCNFAQAMDSNQLNLPQPSALPGRSLPLPYVLVADDAFAIRPNLLKPYAQRGLSMVQRVFNYRLSHTRRVIENVFGIMSARFRVLRAPINLDAEKTKKVTLACCVLHNFLITTNRSHYLPPHFIDECDANGVTVPGTWRQDQIPAHSTIYPLEIDSDTVDSPSAREVQEEFANYFVEEGELDWQYQHL